MEFQFPDSETKIHITQASVEGWGEYVMYVATPFRTLIGLTEDKPEDIKNLYMVSQLLGNPQAQMTPQGIGVQAQHVVIPYEGAGIVKHLPLHSYDYAFRLVEMEEINKGKPNSQNWVKRTLSQYAAPMDQSGIVSPHSANGLDLTKNGGFKFPPK